MSNRTHAISPETASIANWACSALALTILLLRLAACRYQQGRFDLTAYIVFSSIAVLAARTTCNALILHWGTVTTPEDHGMAEMLRTGSIMVLVARVLITSFYWLQCILLLLFYRDMMYAIAWACKVIRACWAVIGVTFIAVILATFLECRPIRLYWTDGDHQCTRAYVQLLLQCTSNIAIDVLLLIISAPILKAQAKAFPRNLQLGVLYMLGFFSIIIIGFRIHFIYKDGSVQHARSFWASMQVIVATFVANVPSIYGAAKVKRRKSSVVSLSRVRTLESDYFEMEDSIRRPGLAKT